VKAGSAGYNNVGAIAHVVPPPENNSRPPRMPSSQTNRPTDCRAQLGNAVWTIVSLRKCNGHFRSTCLQNCCSLTLNAAVKHFYEIPKQSKGVIPNQQHTEEKVIINLWACIYFFF
jgi:hypothetical protein